YVDLQARFGLDDETVERWQSLGILYDRNADGEFLHLYSETIGGLFIELVQRVDSYRDYGPGNAAVRVAAQEQHEQLDRLFSRYQAYQDRRLWRGLAGGLGASRRKLLRYLTAHCVSTHGYRRDQRVPTSTERQPR